MKATAEEEIDHYVVLGLPSGEEGETLTLEDIKKAYKAKSLLCHPDKRPDDRDAANAEFLRLRSSFDILCDDQARRAFDALLRVKRERERERLRRGSDRDSKKRRLEERERRAAEEAEEDPEERRRREVEAASAKLREEVARIRAMHAGRRGAATAASTPPPPAAAAAAASAGVGLDGERTLKVSWEKGGEDYGPARLREIFGRFGEVVDVLMRSKGTKKMRSAFVVMASKDAMVAATKSMSGSLLNPLLVLPLHPMAADNSHSSSVKETEQKPLPTENLVGARYQAFEDNILKKLLQKVCNT
ncbi:Chaperone protein dnaJ 10 [Acorus calamus]|uniref:Chaperone protein dnaJ 10 n=1 Tax=Acorus calamus TaxID=4465 RepID=A0AAV9F3C1_ACOCL|nr:Chaperone protein dnaJ 10 [Acorus calamus]